MTAPNKTQDNRRRMERQLQPPRATRVTQGVVTAVHDKKLLVKVETRTGYKSEQWIPVVDSPHDLKARFGGLAVGQTCEILTNGAGYNASTRVHILAVEGNEQKTTRTPTFPFAAFGE